MSFADRAVTAPDPEDERETVVFRIPRQFGPPPAHQRRLRARRALRRWWLAHWGGAAMLTPVLVGAGLVTGWNLQGWPGRLDDDEGTYVAEAWAMLSTHHLSNYTYWYDHPPLGWAQIAVFGWLAGGFRQAASAVMLGRDFMWCVTLVSCVLLYVLCRRLGLRRATACAAVALFAASPLALMYHRMVSLDNIAVAWLLASLAIAASRRHSLASAFWSGVTLAVAIGSKETIVILVPGVVWVLWQHTDRRTRRWHFGIFGVTVCLLLAGYPLFALLRGELLPGHGHVSLLSSLWWQFVGRAGSGSPLTVGSTSRWLVNTWFDLDPCLLGLGIAAAVPALLVRRLRPAAIALLTEVLVPFKGGYLPYFYVTAMLPFAAVCVAGAGEELLLRFGGPRFDGRRFGSLWVRQAGRAVTAACMLGLAVVAGPQWAGELAVQSQLRGDAGELAATRWIEQNVASTEVVAVDDYLWPDLKLAGMNPVWVWKADGDPEVSRAVLPDGWQSIRFVVLTPKTVILLNQLPTLAEAVRHSVVLANFGQGVTVREVLSAPASPTAMTEALGPPPPPAAPPTARPARAGPAGMHRM
jgi:4-amino-4-deoxy-L-arabinose transferase-like glycosyltransferase